MNFETHALAVFYSDAETVLQAVIAWTGMMLYRALATLPDARQKQTPRVAAALSVAFYFGVFPIPARAFSGWLVLQHLAAVGALAAIGPVVLHGVILDERGLRSAARPVRLSPTEIGLLYAPAAAVIAWMVVDAARVVPVFLDDPARGGALADAAVIRDWTRAGTAVVLYMGVSAPFAHRNREALRGVRLDAVERWSALTAAATAVWAIVMGATYLAWGPESAAAHRARLGFYLLALGPGLVELRWAYDAVLRRVLAFHLLLVFYACLVVGGYGVVTALGLVDPVSWGVVLTSLAGSALVLPQAIERGLERRIFPRAAALRARLVAIATQPGAGSRADAGADLLARVVEAVDCEGGLVVLQPTTDEPATVVTRGRVHPSALGATAAEAARYLGALRVGSQPRDVRSLPLADQVRLGACDVTLVCPLVGERLQGTLLLGPRRGWTYDELSLEGLEMLGHNAGPALENLSLVAARLAAERALAHREKLAALGEAAARIAHEIRNPLAAARSLVQQTERAADASELGDAALGELDRIGRLVTDLLTFARRDDVRDRVTVDLVGICRDGLRQVRALAETTKVGVESVLSASSVPIRGDHDRLVQVVSNLCRNAIEAMVEAPAPRQIRLRCAADDGVGFVEVQDGGPGITPEELPGLFEPFRTTKRSGTGLGLSIARQIVEAHGGRLVVESLPGVETRFRVELPLVAAV